MNTWTLDMLLWYEAVYTKDLIGCIYTMSLETSCAIFGSWRDFEIKSQPANIAGLNKIVADVQP